MKPNFEILGLDLCVPLTLKQFIALEKRDEYNNTDENVHLTLDSMLTSLTHAEKIDFNGHFGANVYFSISNEFIGEADVVATMIKMYATKRSYLDIFQASLKSTYSHKNNTGFISAFEYRMGVLK